MQLGGYAYTTLNHWIISEQRNENDVEGDGCDVIRDIIPALGRGTGENNDKRYNIQSPGRDLNP
jgi:hypothetical protein